jgi:hypothetical protein
MKPKFEEAVRAAVILIAVLAVTGYAYVFKSEAALGAVIGLLGLGASFLFRAKLVAPTAERSAARAAGHLADHADP